ncbi:hypothetical protein [Brevibacterium oceani]|uniref:hypothetical protein n=1 Tax=Brevibacterium oceani TaxID=358099 RepID=UPI0015E7A3B5|nr:hypothetical protein [Brevibacterium oceani]
MRHDEERPRTNRFLCEGTVPGHWTQVLGGMRANPFTRLSLDDVLTKAAHVLILSPTLDVARACCGELLAAADPDSPGNPRITITALDDFVASDVPAGTWIFLPHRQDGWTELEAASAKLRSALVKENSTRETGSKLVLVEYGINLWMWADPPSSGGDPVCHAGELISWESAWALGAGAADGGSATSSARPPIYFGLPPILRKRRWES